MALRTDEKSQEINLILQNKKIAELKKRILLAEGQKKAYVEEWEHQDKQNSELISELKTEIKEHSIKLKHLQNLDSKKPTKEPLEIIRKIPYPVGAKTVDEALHICDLHVIDLTKKLDLLNDKFIKRKEHYNKLLEKYNAISVIHKNDSNNKDAIEPIPPQTFEEDEHRKIICHLENEIHRTNVQWMEAEHIRKKYNSIKGSLMNDSEKFEKSLLELEKALTEQQADINRIQGVHHEAIQMRDGTKIILLRQEHAANSSSKTRDRQAFDFRQQVEERRLELERLERKLFTSGKQLVQQGSMDSLTGDQQIDKINEEQDPNAQAKESTNVMEIIFKKLMEVTGATSTNEVLERFIAQKEATSRLNYLRTVTEGEKKHLEMQREHLLAQLESFKFADVKENEVNQEQVEQIKNDIVQAELKEKDYILSTKRTENLIDSIRNTLIDLILKLHEIDDMIDPINNVKSNTEIRFDTNDLINGNISNEIILQILEDKLRKGLLMGPMLGEYDSGISDEDIKQLDDLKVPHAALSPKVTSPCPSPRPASTLNEERPQPYPICYTNLIAGRSTGQTSATSAGQPVQPVATDDEGEVPSRNYLKRQAMVIVDSKSRRKGFRAPAPRRK